MAKLKYFIIKVVEKLHLLVFGQTMSDQMKVFLGNLSWSFYAGIIAMPISMVVGTLAGRFMGPAEYGSYNLVILISSYVTVFSFLGLDISIIRNVAKAKTHIDKERSFFSSLVFVASMTIIYALIGLIFRNKIAGIFGLNKTVILFVIIYTLVVSFKLVQDILVRALEEFKLQAISRMIEVLILALGFIFVMVVYKRLDFGLYMGLVLLAALIVGVIYFVNLKGYFNNFSLIALRQQLSEGKFFMLSGILGTVFLSADRLLVAKYIGITALGIYSAYYAASLSLVAAMSLILTNVLFPATAKSDDKSFTKKIDQLFIKGLVPIFLAICLAIFVFLSIFGKAYPLKLDYILLFALVSTLYFFLIVYNVVILDAGPKRYTQYFYAMSSVNLATVGYYFLILKYVSQSIEVVLVGFAVNLIINLSIQRMFVRKMRREQNQDIPGIKILNTI